MADAQIPLNNAGEEGANGQRKKATEEGAKKEIPWENCWFRRALLAIVILLVVVVVMMVVVVVLATRPVPNLPQGSGHSSGTDMGGALDMMKLREIMCGNEKESSCWVCPNNWSNYKEKCFFFSNEAKNWDSSRADCLSRKADLLHVNDGEKNFIESKLPESRYWIGLRREDGKDWVWLNGTSFPPDRIQTKDQSSTEKCAILFKEKQLFNAELCTELNYWICERKATLLDLVKF